MTFARPLALLLLGLLVPVLILSFRRRAATPGFGLTLLLRLAFLAALILALARPVWQDAGAAPRRVVVVDVSESAGSLGEVQQRLDALLARVPDGEDLRLVAFAGEARVVPPLPGRTRSFPGLSSVDLPRTASHAAAGIEAALALVPEGVPGAVALLTDGRDTAGLTEAAAASAARRGIPVDVFVDGAQGEGPLLTSLATPAAAPVGSTVEIAVEVEARGRGPFTVMVRDRAPRSGVSTAVLVESARTSAGFRHQGVARHEVATTGENLLDLVVKDAAGRDVLGRGLAIFGSEPWAVALVEDRAAPSVRDAVQGLLGAGFKVERRLADELGAETDWNSVRAAVVADVPAVAFSDGALTGLARATEEGLGLFLAGGRRSFGPGGWSGTPLEELSPVRFVQKEERRDPSATLVVIIDTSGSMSGNRIELAKEVARLAMRRLKPHDKAGIVEFHGAKRWAAPIQPASNAVDLQRALNRLVAGGGTVIFPAIEEAYFGLLNVRTRTRHVLVITDGGVEQGAFEALARKMADHGMTVSTVLVGASDGHSDFLVSLAQWGRGRFYHAPDRFNLPEVLVKQPESSLLAPYSEAQTTLLAADDAAIVEDAKFDDAAMLAGVVQTETRPEAEALLRTREGEPLLARWQVGNGTVFAWTSEVVGPWSRSLPTHPEYPRLLAGVLREASRGFGAGELRVVAEPVAGRLFVRVIGLASGKERSRVEVEIVDAEGRRTVERLELPGATAAAGPGIFVPVTAPGVARITVRDEGGAELAAGLVDVPRATEWTRLDPDAGRAAALAAVSGGRSGALSERSGRGRAARELFPHCLFTALAAFLLLVFVRRLPARLAGAALVMATLVPTSFAQDAAAARPPLDDAVKALLGRAEKEGDLAALAEALRLVRARDGDAEAVLGHLEAGLAARPDDAQLAILLAEAAATAGLPERGARPLAKLAERLPLPATGFGTLARLQELLGRDQEALAALDRALASGPSRELDFALRLRRASILLTRPNGQAGAVKDFRALVAGNGGSPDLGFYLGMLAALHGAPDLLLELDARGGDTAVHDHLLVGTMQLRSGRAAEAERHFGAAAEAAALVRDRRFAEERLIAAHREAGTLSDLAERWLAETPRSRERMDALVSVLRELRRPEAALDLLVKEGRAVGEGATQAAIPEEELQREIIGLALECGRDAEVATTYTALIGREPRKLAWRSGLALLHLLRGERDLAAGVFDAATAATDDGKQLLRIAAAARDLALEVPAERAAEKALSTDEASKIRAHLFLAEASERKGLNEASAERLRAIEAEFGASDDALLQVADAWDRYRREDEAVRVLRIVAERTGGEDVLMRLAWLLEKRKGVAEALALWQRVWRETKIPARARQAEDRVLALAAREAKLADIAIDLEETLERKEGGPRELSLLVKIYARANDPIAAVEILREHAARLGQGEVETLAEMARVYQHCDDYRRYEATLRDLQTKDPASKLDYQEQLALGALERGRGKQVKRALDELLVMAGDNLEALEFSAGALGLVQLHDQAVRAYARVLARHPDRIEGFLLLGNALRDAGRRDEGIRLFQDLVEKADKDDLFTIAVDGILNLQAPRPVLLATLRRVRERIAERPQKAFLYQLAADLAEELGDRDGQARAMELMALVGGERRAPILREMMDLATARGRPDDLIRFGRSLIALGEIMPPDVFLELGQALVRTGDLVGAERVFARTREAGDFVSMQQRIAGYYEAAARHGDAERILRQALLAKPDDLEILAKVAELAEAAGHVEQARRDYVAGVDVLLVRSPSKIAEEAKPDPKRPNRLVVTTASGTRVVHLLGSSSSYDPNADPYLRLSPPLVRGLIATSGPELLPALEARIATEIEALEAGKLVGERLDANLRLSRLLAIARDAACAFGDLDFADRLDERVMKVFPGDEAWRKAAVDARLEGGYLRRARRLAAVLRLDPDKDFEALATDSFLRGPGRMEKLLAETSIPPRDAAAALPWLVARGETAAVKTVLAATTPGAGSTDQEGAATLANAALAVGAMPAFEVWLLEWLEATMIGGSGPGPAAAVEGQVREAFTLLGDEAREAVLAKFQEVLGRVKKERRGPYEQVWNRFSKELGKSAAAAPVPAEQLLAQASTNLYELLGIVAAAPAAEQAGLLAVSLEKAKLVHRGVLIRFLDQTAGDVLPEVSDRLVDAFRAAGRRERNNLGPAVAWQANQLLELEQNLPTAARYLGILAEEQASDPVITAARLAFELRLGRTEETREPLVAAVAKILEKKTLEWAEAEFVEKLANESDARFRDIVGQVLARMEADGATTPASTVVKAALLQREGKVGQALGLLWKAFKEAPDDYRLRNKLEQVLGRRGRPLEQVALLEEATRGRSDDDAWLFNDLAETYVLIDRPLRALDALDKAGSDGDLGLRFQLERRLGRDDAAVGTFRRHMAQVRGVRFSRGFDLPTDAGDGGLAEDPPEGEDASPKLVGPARSFVHSVYWRLAAEPWARPILAAAVRGRTEGRVFGLDALGAAALRGRLLSEGREALLGEIASRTSGGEFGPDDATLLFVLAAEATEAEWPRLLPALDLLRDQLLVVGDGDDVMLSAVADLYAAAGANEKARALYGWLMVDGVVGRQGAGSVGSLLERFEPWLATWPEADRAAVRRRVLVSFRPNPLRKHHLGFTTRVLGIAEAAGDAEAAAEQRAALIATLEAGKDLDAKEVLNTRSTLARSASRRGDLPGFEAQIAAIVALVGKDSKLMVPSPVSLLPSARKAEKAAELADAVMPLVLAARQPTEVDDRRLALASWLVSAKAPEKARELVRGLEVAFAERARELHTVADIARRAGDLPFADALERRLLEDGGLNLQRYPRVLDRIAELDGEATARELAVRLSELTDNAAVLERAIEAALDRGDRPRAKDLVDRLAATTPAHPKLASLRARL